MILPVGLLSRKSVFLLEQVNNARSGGKGGAGTNKKGEKQRRKSEGGTKKKEVPKEGIDAPPTSAKKVTLAEPPQVWLPTKLKSRICPSQQIMDFVPFVKAID